MPWRSKAGDPCGNDSDVSGFRCRPPTSSAMAHLKEAGTPVRDELEPLGDFPGHWISDPAGNILLVSQKGVESTLIPAG
jgi:hypothetical protein